MLMVIDQMSVDKGSWTLDAVVSSSGPCQQQLGQLAYSRLLDARWAEVSLTDLREQMDFSEDLLEPEPELPEGTVFSAPPLYVGLACYPAYSELWRRECRSRVHINIAELEAYLREEARAGCRRPCHRFLFGIDSQVALGAVVKGRSASPALNELLSRSIAPYVGFHVLPHLVFFPTAVNPAAGGWAELCTGRHATLDKVTRDEGFAVDGDGFSQDDLFELGGTPAPALHSNGFCKRAAFRAPRAAPLAPPVCALPASRGPLVPAPAQDRLCAFPLRQFVCGKEPPGLEQTWRFGLVLWCWRRRARPCASRLPVGLDFRRLSERV